MEALKWFGYIVAAIAVLSVGAGIGAIVAFVWAVICLVIAVLIVASAIKWLVHH